MVEMVVAAAITLSAGIVATSHLLVIPLQIDFWEEHKYSTHAHTPHAICLHIHYMKNMNGGGGW
jgi:hypothetical protein